MTEQNPDPEHATVSYLAYVRDVHNELVRRTRVEAHHAECMAALDAGAAEAAIMENPLKVSGRGIRSAIATLCFKHGLTAADLLKMPVILNGELPSPSTVCSELLRFEAARLLNPGTTFTDAEWGAHTDLNYLLFGDVHLFMSFLMGVALTEDSNSDAGKLDGENGEITPHILVEADEYGIINEDMFNSLGDPINDPAGMSGVLLTLPQNLVVVAEALMKIPSERRGAAAAEIIRYANIAPVFEQNNEFPGFAKVAVAIYG